MAAIELPHPRTVASLHGYQAIEAQLAEQFRAGSLHHSLLITGPKGIGKATLAYRFARFLLSGGAQLSESESHPFSLFGPEPTDGLTEGDGALYMPESHGIFKRVASASHADLLTIEPAFDAKKGVQKDEIQADVARAMGEFLSLTSAESDFRVVVIDAADQLNEKAANALLKSVEEPPERAYVIIVCHNPLSILPTIRSRCRTIKLSIPDLASFAAVLRTQAPSIDMQNYDALRTLSFGSPGFAITLSAHHAPMLYRAVLDNLSRTSGLPALQRLATELVSSKSPEGWGIAKHVLLQAIERASQVPQGLAKPMYDGEKNALEAIYAKSGVAGLLSLRDKATQLFATTDSLNLDKQAAMLSVLKAA